MPRNSITMKLFRWYMILYRRNVMIIWYCGVVYLSKYYSYNIRGYLCTTVRFSHIHSLCKFWWVMCWPIIEYVLHLYHGIWNKIWSMEYQFSKHSSGLCVWTFGVILTDKQYFAEDGAIFVEIALYFLFFIVTNGTYSATLIMVSMDTVLLKLHIGVTPKYHEGLATQSE